MNQVAQLCGYFAIVFAIAVGASYLLTSFRLKRKLGNPIEGGTLQLRSSSGVYRSKFARKSQSGWHITAPLKRDAYVPIRVGEKLTVVLPTDKGLKSFESEVIQRDGTNHELTIAIPSRMNSVERRSSERTDRFLNPSATIEGHAATLLDLSAGGARLITESPIRRGERAAIDFPGSQRVFGWILDSSPSNPGYVLRLRFEEPFSNGSFLS